MAGKRYVVRLSEDERSTLTKVIRAEMSALTRQCLSRRIGTIEKMASEVAAWDQARNRDAVRVNWRFSIEQARTKLHRVYPQPQT